MAACLQLNEVGALPEETVNDILIGLSHFSMPYYARLLDFLLQQAKLNDLDAHTHEGSLLEKVKIVMSKTVDAYDRQ